MAEKIKDLRVKIDKIDDKILKLIEDRAKTARRIGDVKLKSRSKKDSTIYRPAREAVILRRIKASSQGQLPPDNIETIFREIIGTCRSLEMGLTVSYLGPEATFCHLAARNHFGSATVFRPARTIRDIFNHVESGKSNFGVAPIENTTGGTIAETLDSFVDSPLNIVSQVLLRVSHCLLRSTANLDGVRKIYTHPQALMQCWEWMEHNLPRTALEETFSTAEAARRASREKSSAAIASELAAEIYGLNVVAANIEDNARNMTRFMVIGPTMAEKTGRDKTSVLFSLKDESGILHKALEPFSKRKLNLSKIESRPLKGKPWEYIFFIDIAGHCKDRKVKAALSELEQLCHFFKVLGSYPAH